MGSIACTNTMSKVTKTHDVIALSMCHFRMVENECTTVIAFAALYFVVSNLETCKNTKRFIIFRASSSELPDTNLHK